MTTPVYLDNNATTRVAEPVLAAMLPYFREHYGNPASLHTAGQQVAAAVEDARSAVAALINARAGEIIFTSGGTESNNTALRGVLAGRPGKRHIITTLVEHEAVLQPADQLEHEGIQVTRIGVDHDGRLDLDALSNALRDDTALVSVMLANNETGVIHALDEVCRIAAEHKVPVHADAVQGVGKIPVDVERLGVHLLSISSHKLYGPKGVGALYIRRGTPTRPFVVGGPQERNRRGGTLNAPGIIGLGAACKLAAERSPDEWRRVAALRDRLECFVREHVPGAVIIGDAPDVPRLPNTTCICFGGVPAEAVLLLLSQAGICASSGSACSSGSLEASHVMQAYGVAPEIAQGQIRFSLSVETTPAEIDRVTEVLPAIIEKVGAVRA